MKVSEWLNAVSLLISLTGFLTGLYFWIYAKKYATSYDIDQHLYFLRIIGVLSLFVLLSLTYAIISLYKEDRRSRILSVINVLFSAAGLFMLAIDSIFLVF